MLVKTINISVDVLVAFTLWCYAIAFVYVLVRAVLMLGHLMPS